MKISLIILSALALCSAVIAEPAHVADTEKADRIKSLYDTINEQMKQTDVKAAYDTYLQLKEIEDPVKLAKFTVSFSSFVAPVSNWYRTRSADMHDLAEKLRRDCYMDTSLPVDIRAQHFVDYIYGFISRNNIEATLDRAYTEFTETFKKEDLNATATDSIFRVIIRNAKDFGDAELTCKYSLLYKDFGKGNPVSLLSLAYLPLLNFELEKTNDFDTVIKKAKAMLEDTNYSHINSQLDICEFIANAYCYYGKPREAIAFLQARKVAPWEARYNQMIYKIYRTYLLHDEGATFAAEQKDFAEEMSFLDYKGKGRDRAIQLLEATDIPGSTNTVNALKGSLVLRFFASSNPEDEPYKKKYEKWLQFANKGLLSQKIRTAMHYCVFSDVITLAKYVPVATRNYNVNECIMFAYIALNDAESAKTLMAELRSINQLSSKELNKLDFISRLAGMKDEKGAFKNLTKSPEFKNLSSNIKSEFYPYAECAALVANKCIVAREAEVAYESLFKKRENKVYEIPFFDKHITGLSDLLSRKNLPAKQIYDRKFGANMDFIVTDVSTGDRGESIGSENKEKYRPTEMQVVCDDQSIHFMLTSYDSKMSEIALGLANAPVFELYISPGENQPYFCILPNISDGSCHIWRSSYHTKLWKDFKNYQSSDTPNECHNEVVYNKDNSIFYFSLPWEIFYDKLPDADNSYEFDNIEWSRFGGNTWNGLSGVHQRNSYGRLKFNISKKQMVAIKRRIVIDAMKAFKKENKATGSYCGAVFRWNDNLFGDPTFYSKRISENEKRLSKYAAMVTPDMADETVELLYREAVSSWYNFKTIIEESRTDYLSDKYFAE